MANHQEVRKKILITGTSSGFGRRVVRPLLERGHFVICAMRGGKARLSEILSEESKEFGSRILAIDIHMEKPETFELAAKLIEERLDSKLDVLINNAGYGLFGAIEDQSVEQIRHQFDVNVFGPILLTRRLMPYLRNAQGRVINLSSVAGLVTFPFYSTYSASKYAIEAFSEGLYYEARPLGVQVALIEPGGFRTDFSTRSLNWGANSNHSDSPYFKKTLAFRKLLEASSGRLGNPKKVVNLMVRLCEKKKIPLRTAVGLDAKFFRFLKWVLPEPIFIGLVHFVWNKIAFRD